MSGVVLRYFPWAPKIPWKMRHGKFLIPELSQAIWSRVISNHDPIVVSNGGLMEAYYSLSYFELLNLNFHTKKFYWSGDPKFNSLIRINALAEPVNKPLDKSFPVRFPTPLFMDTVGNVYLNALNDYTFFRSMYGGKNKPNYLPLIQQIANNSTQPWDERCIPVMRNWNLLPAQISQWAKVNRFNLQKPYVVICPDRGLSMHKQSALGWNEMQVRSVASMLMQSGIQTIVFTNHMRKMQSNPAWFVKADIPWMLFFASTARAILSEEIDMLMVTLGLSEHTRVIGKPLKYQWSLEKNAKFLGRKQVILEMDELTPYLVFQAITEEYGRKNDPHDGHL